MNTPSASQKYWNKFFHHEFAKESDRAAVILTASMLEQALEVMLKTSLVPCSSHEDPLFDAAYAPLNTFSAKIELSYRIGLISRLEARILNLVRKLRNDFAHTVTGCSFEHAPVHSRVIELVRIAGVVEDTPELRDGYAPGSKGDFQMTMSWILWTLWGRAENAVQVVEARADWRPSQSKPKQTSAGSANPAGQADGNRKQRGSRRSPA